MPSGAPARRRIDPREEVIDLAEGIASHDDQEEGIAGLPSGTECGLASLSEGCHDEAMHARRSPIQRALSLLDR
jgi:hypothetical protein